MKICIGHQETNLYQERIDRTKNNIGLLLKSLQEENATNMLNILNGNPNKYRARADAYQQRFAKRLSKVLSANK